jgi:AcrR family transcriptional regulator
MDLRDRIIQSAARVFAETGYRGATTRRIAQAADVNEVTLFRHFGSKDELIREAIGHAGRQGDFARLPEDPVDPAAELTEWCRRHLRHLYGVRAMIRTCMGESEEHPEIVTCATERPMRVKVQLRDYLLRLRARGLAASDFDPEVAAAVLMAAVFTDAMSRDLMPESYEYGLDEAAERYVAFFLRAIARSPSHSESSDGT